MNTHVNRRELFRTGTQCAFAAAVFSSVSGESIRADARDGGGDAGKLWPGYPRHDQKLVAEIVGAAHFNEQRVKELVKTSPELVNAWWDWGFGDWESPLGAASHVGHRGIAEFLLAHGARIDIFAAAMLGFTDVVTAFVAAQPGVQRTQGPHGISLLAHAKAGGKEASGTVAYLEKLGDANGELEVVPLAAESMQKYLGQFASNQLNLKLICRLNKAERLVVDIQTDDNQSNGRLIHYQGDDEFYPAGVPSVRIRFAVGKEKSTAVTIRAIRGTVPELTLHRSGD